MKQKPPSFLDAALVVGAFGAMVSYAIIALEAPPHIPMLLGCAVASIVAVKNRVPWKQIEQSMIDAVSQAMVSIIILLMIGVLIGVWICSGVVPSMIYYGLSLLSPRFFLVSCMTICAVVSMALGSWGTAGTIGIAMIGISQVIGIPVEITAGSVISGCYIGDKISPLADTTNLISAVTGVDLFENVKAIAPLCAGCFVLSGSFYLAIGWKYSSAEGLYERIAELSGYIKGSFAINPIALLPLVLLILCILLKVPSIPSIFVGMLSASVLAVVMQRQSLATIVESAYYGYTCNTGNAVIDELLTAGGIEAMLSSVSLILIAMMFGGIMEHCGLIAAFMQPLVKRLSRAGSIIAAAVVSCMAVNAVLPEQYVAIALPGKMFASTFDEKKIPKTELTRALGAGGAAFSALVPWNTCGVFMTSVLGVATAQYFPYAYLGLTIPLLTILMGYLRCRKRSVCQ